MNNDVAIRIENLIKKYKIYNNCIDRLKEALHPFGKRYSRDFYALNDVSLSINRGEMIGIIGQNGAGKSTLLKIITGVLTPSSGQVYIRGKIAALLELGAGFNPEFTGIENIYLVGTIMGFSKEEMDAKMDTILSFADIGDFAYQQVKMYSSGMFARLAFSVNISVVPDILIVDEALAVGDIFFQQKCLNQMKKMKENGTTILYVSHALQSVKTLCSTAIYIKQGRIICIGEAEEVCSKYQNDLTEKPVEEAMESNNEIVLNNLVDKKDDQLFRIDELLNSRIVERSGNGALRLTALDFYDQRGKKVKSIPMMSKFKIVSSYKVNENIPAGAAIGLLCRDKIGIDIFASNSNLYEVYLPEMKKGEVFTYSVEVDVPLMPGEYVFSTGVKVEVLGNCYYDRCFAVEVIEVVPTSEYPNVKYTGGIMYVNSSEVKIVTQGCSERNFV